MNTKKIDLLRKQFKASIDPIERFEAFIDIAREYTVKGPKIERRFACIISKGADKLNYKRGNAIANDLMAYADIGEGQLNNALQKFQTSKSLWAALKNVELELAAEHNIAIVHTKLGDTTKALESLFSILKRLEKENISIQFQGNVKGNIGIALSGFGNHTDAIKFIKESIELSKEAIDIKTLATRYQNLAAVHLRIGEYDKAENACYTALTLAEEAGYDAIKISILAELSTCSFEKKQHQDAINHLLHAKKIAKGLGYKLHVNLMLEGKLAEKYAANGEKAKAINCIKEGNKICISTQDQKEIRNFHWDIGNAYALLGDYKAAFNSVVAFKNLNDQIVQEESSKRIDQLKISYQLDHYKNKLDKLDNEKNVQKTIIKPALDYQKLVSIPTAKGSFERLKYRDIVMFHISDLDKTVRCHYIDVTKKLVEAVPVAMQLDAIEKKWFSYFIQVNRQTIINPLHIKKLKHYQKDTEKGEIIMTPSISIPIIVSKENKKEVWRKINSHQSSLS